MLLSSLGPWDAVGSGRATVQIGSWGWGDGGSSVGLGTFPQEQDLPPAWFLSQPVVPSSRQSSAPPVVSVALPEQRCWGGEAWAHGRDLGGVGVA